MKRSYSYTLVCLMAVALLALGTQSPDSRKSGMVVLACVAKRTCAIGKPMRRAQIHANPLPRFPVGTIKLLAWPVFRKCSRLALA